MNSRISPVDRWALISAAVAAMAVGVIGAINSFAAVATAMTPWFGSLAWTVPLGIDLGIAAFVALDLVLIRVGLRVSWLRIVPTILIIGTVYLNVAGQTDPMGIVGHALLPALWIAAVEVAGSVLRAHALGRRTLHDRVPLWRWLLDPFNTLILWRRMKLWQESVEGTNYGRALDAEAARQLARCDLIEHYGSVRKAPRRERVLYRQGIRAGGAPDAFEAPAPADEHDHTGEPAPAIDRSPSTLHVTPARWTVSVAPLLPAPGPAPVKLPAAPAVLSADPNPDPDHNDVRRTNELPATYVPETERAARRLLADRFDNSTLLSGPPGSTLVQTFDDEYPGGWDGFVEDLHRPRPRALAASATTRVTAMAKPTPPAPPAGEVPADLLDLIQPAREIAAEHGVSVAELGRPRLIAGLRQRGYRIGTDRAQRLLRLLSDATGCPVADRPVTRDQQEVAR